MSFEAQAWAAKVVLKSPSEKAVLNALANCADQDGVCWPSIPYIAEVTAWTTRTVIRCLAALESAGMISREQRFHEKSGMQRSNVYRIRMDWQPVSEAKKTEGGGDTMSPPGVTPCQGGGDTVSPLKESSIESSLKESSSEIRQPDPEDARLAAWMWDLVAAMGVKTKPPNLDRWADQIRLMRERDKHTHHEQAKLFRWANADPFWRSNILSPGKLRERWMQLWLKANFDKPQATHEQGLGPCEHCQQPATLRYGHRLFCDVGFEAYREREL